MKKFSIKTVLVLLLVLLLVFTMVACGGKDDNGGNNGGDEPCKRHVDNNCDGKCDTCGTKTTVKHTDKNGDGKCDKCGTTVEKKYDAAQFFQGLWDSAATIGKEEVKSGDDVAFDLGLNVAIDKGDENVLDLGIAASIVLDKTNDGANSAARVQLYNHNTNENWLTLYFFLNDPYHFYVDWADQQVKIGADLGFNDTWAGVINSFVSENKLIAEKSIVELIETFTKEFGDDWNLDGLINSLTGLLGLDLVELINSLGPDLLNTVNGILVGLAKSQGIMDYEGIDVDALAESDSMILDLLKGVGPVLFGAEKETDGDTTTYKAGLDLSPTGLIGSVKGLLGNLPMGLSEVLDSLTEVAFEYQTVKNDGVEEIDNFAILLGAETDSDDLAIQIGINEIAIVATDAEDNTFGIDTDDYSSNFALDAEVTLKTSNQALVLWDKDVSGDYKLALKGQVDLLNVENNATAAELTLTDGSTQLAKATYAGGTLALSVNSENAKVALFAEEIGPMIVNAFAGATKVEGEVTVPDTVLQTVAVQLANKLFTEEFADAAAIQTAYAAKADPANTTKQFTFDPTFKGVALTGIELVDLFTGLFKGEPSYNASAAAGETPLAWSPSIMAILNLITEVFDGNIKDGLTLSVDDLGELILSVFVEDQGPADTSEFCYGNGAEVVGAFEKVTYNEDGTIAERDNGEIAEAAIAKVLGNSAWAANKEGKLLETLFGSELEVSARVDEGEVKLGVEAKCNGSTVSIGLKLAVKATSSAFTVTPVDHTAEGFIVFDLPTLSNPPAEA